MQGMGWVLANGDGKLSLKYLHVFLTSRGWRLALGLHLWHQRQAPWELKKIRYLWKPWANFMYERNHHI